MCVSVSECVNVCMCAYVCSCFLCVCIWSKLLLVRKICLLRKSYFFKYFSVQNILWSNIFFSRKNVLVEKNCFLQKSFSSKFLLKCFVWIFYWSKKIFMKNSLPSILPKKFSLFKNFDRNIFWSEFFGRKYFFFENYFFVQQCFGKHSCIEIILFEINFGGNFLSPKIFL